MTVLPTDRSRDNDLFVTYSYALADAIGIFWQFHDERVRLGNLPFASTHQEGHSKPVHFSPQGGLERASKEGKLFEPIFAFSDAIRETMDASLQQFLIGNGVARETDHLLSNVEVPQISTRFFNPFVTERIELAHGLYDNYFQKERDKDFRTELRVGIYSGVDTALQLYFLSPEKFTPRMPVSASKIHLVWFPALSVDLGLSASEQSYPLLDDSNLGLDSSRLRSMGRGEALGCPASLRVTRNAREFLSLRGIDARRITMLGDFAEKLPPRGEEYLGSWFRGLKDTERQFIEPEQIRIMSGEARRSALEIRATAGCPYGKERG